MSCKQITNANSCIAKKMRIPKCPMSMDIIRQCAAHKTCYYWNCWKRPLKNQKSANEKLEKDKKQSNEKSLQDRLRQIREEMAANQLAIESSTSITEQADYYKKITELKKEQLFLTEEFTDSELILKYERKQMGEICSVVTTKYHNEVHRRKCLQSS